MFRRVIETVVALEFRDDRLLQRRGAADRRVFGEALVDRVDGRIFDVLRRIEIRFARAQTDESFPSAFSFAARAVTARVGEGLMACTRREVPTSTPIKMMGFGSGMRIKYNVVRTKLYQ